MSRRVGQAHWNQRRHQILNVLNNGGERDLDPSETVVRKRNIHVEWLTRATYEEELARSSRQKTNLKPGPNISAKVGNTVQTR